jgi:hypothetical protein
MSTGEHPRPKTNAEEEMGRPLFERVTRIEGSLENGRTEFSGMREHIRRVERQVEEGRVKPMTRMQLLGFVMGPVVGILVLCGGYVWSIAKYPDREEFNAVVHEIHDTQERLYDRIGKLEQAQLRQDAALGEASRDAARLEKTLTDRLDRLEKKR